MSQKKDKENFNVWEECPVCHQKKYDFLDIENIRDIGECLSCENHRGEAIVGNI